MIIQSLVKFYENMVESGELLSEGWVLAPISYVLDIDRDGNILNINHTVTPICVGKKIVHRPISAACPAFVIRSSAVKSNFLYDNSEYILGVGQNGEDREKFGVCKKLHHEILDGLNSEAASAILAFFDKWNPQESKKHLMLKEFYDDVISGCNLTFRFNGRLVSEYQEIAEAWNRHYSEKTEFEGFCLATGNYGPIERIHPKIRGFVGAQASGASLISFNSDSCKSYGKDQGFNAPISRYAAFAYTSALNYLIKDQDRQIRIGDTAVFFWADGKTSASEKLIGFALNEQNPYNYNERELWDKIVKLADGGVVEFEGVTIDPTTSVCILGLSPNIARVFVRFFCQNTIGGLFRNLLEHQKRLRIDRSVFDEDDTVPMWKLLNAVVNQNVRDKSPIANMAGETIKSILANTEYPATLLSQAIIRSRCEGNVTHVRAAIIKAYYLKNPHYQVPREVLTMSLNKESNDIPYCLGRIFAVLEKIEKEVGCSTVSERYYALASATPAATFTMLLRRTNRSIMHIRMERPSIALYLEKKLENLIDKIDNNIPAHLSIAEQGMFHLGYYHQKTDLYTKQEEEDNV